MMCSRALTRSLIEILVCRSGPGSTFSTPNSIRFFVGNKHWNPKWRKFRALKMIPVDLPDFHKKRKDPSEMTPDELRSHYKEMGIQPVRPWHERQLSLTCTGSVVEPYLPPEGDGKLSPLNSAGAKQKLEWLKKKGKSWKDLRTIRNYDDEFDLYPDFVEKAHDIYVKAHSALAENDEDSLIGLVTEKAYPEILFNTQRKTIRWKMIKPLEPARVSHVRTAKLMAKEHVFAQITVRLHTQQTLAVYDRFGRLLHGSETVAKDVLEYVVYEKLLSSEFGDWRIHGKLIPDWLPPKEPTLRTYVETITEDDITQAEAESETATPVITVPGISTTVPTN